MHACKPRQRAHKRRAAFSELTSHVLEDHVQPPFVALPDVRVLRCESEASRAKRGAEEGTVWDSVEVERGTVGCDAAVGAKDARSEGEAEVEGGGVEVALRIGELHALVHEQC